MINEEIITTYNYILIFLLIILLLVSNQVYAQNHSFKHFTVDEGLPSSEIYNAYQTSKGYILLTTDRGVSIFDGYDFTNYSLQEGVPDNTVFEMFENIDNDELWFYSFSGKIFSFSKGQFSVLPKLMELVREFNFVRFINSIYVANDGVIWLTLSINDDDGFICITEKGEIIKNVLPDSSSKIQTLYKGKNRYSIAMNKKGDEWTVFLKDKSKINITNIIEKEKITQSVWGMIENDSSIFLQFPSSILQVNKNNKSYHRFKTNSNAINNIYFDNQGDLWVGLIQQGALKFPNANISSQPKRLLETESVTSILQDSEGGYWFTTLDNGVFYMPWEEFYSYDETNRVCNTITLQHGDLWAGYAYGEIIQYSNDGKANKFKLPNEYRYNTVQSIVGFSDRIYVNSSNSIHEIFTGDIKTKYEPVYSRKLIKEGNELWAIGNGFYLLESQDVQFSSMEYGFDKWTTSLCRNTDSTYLIGTFDGVWKYDGNKIEINNYKNPVLNERISDIQLMGDITVFATIGNGLILMDSDSLYHLKKEKNGLLSNVCNSVYVENDSTLWISTNSGINKITWFNHTNSNLKYDIASITKQDGLKSAEIHQLLIQNNYVWAATNKGLIKFDKKLADYNKFDIPVYFKSIKINGRQINFDKKIELPYDENNITIDYTALFYKNHEKITYRYKLHNKDKWIYTQNRFIQLSNLTDSKYLFTLEASIDNTHWVTPSREIVFTIHPPIWKTGWFQVLYVLIGGAFVSIFYYLRMGSLKKNTELKRKVLESEYKALKAQLNPHFMFNSLNSINSFILNNDKFSASKYLTKFSKLMRLILENSSESYIPLNKEMETLRLYVEMEAIRIESKFDYRIICDDHLVPEIYNIPAMLVQPFVENAVWHGVIPLKNSKGIITIRFKSYSNNAIECIVEDNGVGRKKSEEIKRNKKSEHQSQAISIIDKRLKVISNLRKYEYNVTIVDKKIGTKVSILIPLKPIEYD